MLMIEERLSILRWNKKEIDVYLYLVQYGVSSASEMAKHLWYPKSTVNFIAENLWKQGYLTKSMRTNTHYYEANLLILENILKEENEKRQNFINEVLPNLREMNQNVKTKPKIVFLDGEENCKTAYLELLEVQDKFYEFWAHSDLADAFGVDFMDNFIRQRVARWIFCDALWNANEVEKILKEKDTEDLRSISIFDSSFGSIYSSIAIYWDNVLVLNLRWVYSGVRIYNRELAETLKTIFRICKNK